MIKLKKIKYISFYIVFSVLLPKISLASYKFEENSGIKQTAQGTGHSELNRANDIDTLIASVIQGVLSLVGVIFLLLMIYGGYLWMTSRGNEDQVAKAKKIIIESVIGIAIVVAAYAISLFVLSKFYSL